MAERAVPTGGFVVWDDRPADVTVEAAVGRGHKVKVYSYGESEGAVFLLDGGPDFPATTCEAHTCRSSKRATGRWSTTSWKRAPRTIRTIHRFGRSSAMSKRSRPSWTCST